jgi:hypothetical protein
MGVEAESGARRRVLFVGAGLTLLAPALVSLPFGTYGLSRVDVTAVSFLLVELATLVLFAIGSLGALWLSGMRGRNHLLPAVALGAFASLLAWNAVLVARLVLRLNWFPQWPVSLTGDWTWALIRCLLVAACALAAGHLWRRRQHADSVAASGL